MTGENPKQPGNAPEGEWLTPGAERPRKRNEGTVSDPDRYATEPFTPGAGSPPNPKEGTVSNPDF
jgi:hypothetical protein